MYQETQALASGNRIVPPPSIPQQTVSFMLHDSKLVPNAREAMAGVFNTFPLDFCFAFFLFNLWNRSFPLLEGGREPVQAFVETIARRGTACLDIPLPVTQAMQAQLVGHLRRWHGVGQILKELKKDKPQSSVNIYIGQ